MSRRVNMPGADELFRPTVPPRGAGTHEVAAPVVVGDETAPTASGRVKHDEKMTVYLTSEELLALEQLRLALRPLLGRKVDRGRVVRAALAAALEDFEARGEQSELFGRLRD